MLYFLFLMPFFMAFLFRLRGSSFIIFKSEQLTRLFVWAVPCAITEWALFGGPWWTIIGYTIGWFIGIAICPWGPWTGLKTVEEFIILSFRGLLVTLFAGYPLDIWSYPAGLIIILSGLTMGIAYWIGQKIPSSIPCMQQGREMGEVLTAFIIWTIIVVTKVMGH